MSHDRSTLLEIVVVFVLPVLLGCVATRTQPATSARATGEEAVSRAPLNPLASARDPGERVRGPEGPFQRCDTFTPPREVADRVRNQNRDFENMDNVRLFLESSPQVSVPVFFHIITSQAGEGNITDDDVQKQIAALNVAFKSHGFVFALSGITRTSNDVWYRMRSQMPEEAEAKSALARDTSKNLNLYSCRPRNRTGSALLGFATFPWDLAANKSRDGVVIDWTSMPEKSKSDFNKGDTAIHEVGHWLGLYHTFAPNDTPGRSGCDQPGDEVADTPDEAKPNFTACTVGEVDTCPTPGVDPIDNFMDYSHDRCMNVFTAGQGERMRSLTVQYRTGLLVISERLMRTSESLRIPRNAP